MFHLIIPDLTEEESKKLRPFLEAKSAKSGELLIEQGEKERDLFFIFQGKYEIYQRITISGVLIAVKIASVEPPVLFGEGSLFTHYERSATILTVEEGKYFKMTYENFCKVRENEPEIALKLLNYAGNVISQRYAAVRSIIYDNILQDAKTSDHALEMLKNYIGEVHVCTPELAEKLFGKEKD